MGATTSEGVEFLNELYHWSSDNNTAVQLWMRNQAPLWHFRPDIGLRRRKRYVQEDLGDVLQLTSAELG